jgi:ankyrin repeat protein
MEQKELNEKLMRACQSGDIISAKSFILQHADVNYRDDYGFTPLHQAAMNGHPQVVQALIEKGADVNVTDNNGFTPLHQAAMYGREKVVELLLNNGARVDQKTIDDANKLANPKRPYIIDMLNMYKKGGKKSKKRKSINNKKKSRKSIKNKRKTIRKRRK